MQPCYEVRASWQRIWSRSQKNKLQSASGERENTRTRADEMELCLALMLLINVPSVTFIINCNNVMLL